MKKIMITAALVASLITLGYTQDKSERSSPQRKGIDKPREERQVRTPEERAQHITDALEKKLNLSAEQKAKVYALNLERAGRMEKMMKSDREFRKSQMEKQESYRDETDKKLNQILSAEQQKSYQDMKKESREKMKGRRHGGANSRVK